VDNTEAITALSLCAGYGGLELGLAAAIQRPMRVVAVEVEAFALANLVAKTEQGKMAVEAMWPDLRTFPAERFRGCFDFILAGYPCQPFSVAGKRQGEDDPRHLWPHIARIVKAIRPIYGFFENVPGHLTLGFPTVYRSLCDMGYSVEAGLFTAAEVGAPHRRERLFILAYSEHNGFFTREGPRCIGSAVRNTETRPDSTSNSERASKSRELADAECTEQGQGVIEETQAGIGRTGLAVNGSVMADGNGSGCEEQRRAEPVRQEYSAVECGGTRWPARPGQPQHKWEEPRTVMGKLNPNWVENLMGIPCNWTNPLYNGTKNKRDSYGNTNQNTQKELPVLREQVGTEAIQGETGGLQSIPETEVLQSDMLCLRQNSDSPKQKHRKKTSISDKNGKMREVRKQTESSASSRRLQSTTKSDDFVPEVPRRITQSKRDLGEDAKLRVDRLRLLGNGVVPQCAEKAFIELWGKF